MVGPTAGEMVLGNCDDLIAKEFIEYCTKRAAVPIVSDTTTIITLTSEVLESSKRYLL